MTAKELLLAAADACEARPAKQILYGRDQMSCTDLALCFIAPEVEHLTQRYQAYDALAVYLNLDRKHPRPAIWAWNDHPGRTQAEIVAALRGAAASLDEARWQEQAAGREPVLAFSGTLA